MKLLLLSACMVFAATAMAQGIGRKFVSGPAPDRDSLGLGYSQKKMSICFYLQDGVEVLDFAGPMEVFSYAGFQIFTVSRKKEPLTSQGILKILPDYGIEDAPPSDILAFFGGNSGVASEDTAVIEWVRSRKADTKYFFSVCTGAFIMGKAGILDGLTATTFHSSIEGLRKALPLTKVLTDVRFVDNGKVITTAGISAGIDGALHLVAKLKGEEMARQVAAYMEYDKWVPGQGLVVDGK
jgi:transcriptional regulator GlxA family with amidase domain